MGAGGGRGGTKKLKRILQIFSKQHNSLAGGFITGAQCVCASVLLFLVENVEVGEDEWVNKTSDVNMGKCCLFPFSKHKFHISSCDLTLFFHSANLNHWLIIVTMATDTC